MSVEHGSAASSSSTQLPADLPAIGVATDMRRQHPRVCSVPGRRCRWARTRAMAVRTRERDRPMTRPIEQDVLQPGTRAIGAPSRGGRTVAPHAELVLGKRDAVEGPPLRPEVRRPGRSSGDADRVLVVLNPSEPCSPPCTWLKSFPKLPTMQARPFATNVPLSSKSGKLSAAEKPTELELLILLKYDTQPQRRAQSVGCFRRGRFRAVPSRSVGETQIPFIHSRRFWGPEPGEPSYGVTEAPEEALRDLAVVDVGLVDAGLRDVAVEVLQAVGRRRIVDAIAEAIDLR